jgi:lipopolysaccharide/colanic/teichoic acid biosynthesis glycosyltransferase
MNTKSSSYHVTKRMLDLLVAVCLLVVFLPFWVVVPILIKLDSKGPVIYRHKRIGLNGKPFYMYKFRSMVNGAHALLHGSSSSLLQEFKAKDWKLEHDPRITKVGKVLRSLTIDEFPQLLNVIRGEMSMIGPRAYMRAELDEQTKRYPETKPLQATILSVKPGITGPWQVSGRNEIPFVKRAQLDAHYAQHATIVNDIVILFKTPLAMLSKW